VNFFDYPSKSMGAPRQKYSQITLRREREKGCQEGGRIAQGERRKCSVGGSELQGRKNSGSVRMRKGLTKEGYSK